MIRIHRRSQICNNNMIKLKDIFSLSALFLSVLMNFALKYFPCGCTDNIV